MLRRTLAAKRSLPLVPAGAHHAAVHSCQTLARRNPDPACQCGPCASEHAILLNMLILSLCLAGAWLPCSDATTSQKQRSNRSRRGLTNISNKQPSRPAASGKEDGKQASSAKVCLSGRCHLTGLLHNRPPRPELTARLRAGGTLERLYHSSLARACIICRCTS
jgi:hypothetical protein